MTVLLDTHALLWFAEDAPQMPDSAKALLEDPDRNKLLSIASVWEIAIKHGLGKLVLADSPHIYLSEVLRKASIIQLPILFEHAIHAGTLAQHHRDPFDRLIVAQCLIEQIPLVSADAVLDAYGVTRYWDNTPV